MCRSELRLRRIEEGLLCEKMRCTQFKFSIIQQFQMIKKRGKQRHAKHKGKEICYISVEEKIKKEYDSCANILPHQITHKLINQHRKTQRHHVSQDKIRNIQIPYKKKKFQDQEVLPENNIKQQMKPVYNKKKKIDNTNERKKTQNNSFIGLGKKPKKKDNQKDKKRILPKKLRYLTQPHQNELKEIRFLINQSSQIIEDSKLDTRRSQEDKKINVKESVKKIKRKKQQKLEFEKYEEAAIKIQKFWRGILTQKLLESYFNQRRTLNSFNTYDENEQVSLVNSQRNQRQTNQLILENIDFPDLNQEINFQSSNKQKPNNEDDEENTQLKSDNILLNKVCRINTIEKEESAQIEQEQKYLQLEQEHIFKHHRQIFSKEQLKINKSHQQHSSEQQATDQYSTLYMPNSIIVQTHQEYLDSRKSSIPKSKIGSNQQSLGNSYKQMKKMPQEDLHNKKNSFDKQCNKTSENKTEPLQQEGPQLEEKKEEKINYEYNIRSNQLMHLKQRKYKFEQDSEEEQQQKQREQQALHLPKMETSQNQISAEKDQNYHQQKKEVQITLTNTNQIPPFEKHFKISVEDVKEMEIKKWKKIETRIVKELNKPLLRRSPEELLKIILQESRQAVLQLQKFEQSVKNEETNFQVKQQKTLGQQQKGNINQTKSQQWKKKGLKLQLDIIDKKFDNEIINDQKGYKFKKIMENKINNLPQQKEIYQLFKAGFAAIKEKENHKFKLLEKELAEGKISPRSFMDKKEQLKHQFFQEKELMSVAKSDIEKGIKFATDTLLTSNLRQLKFFFPQRSFSSKQNSFLKLFKGVRSTTPSVSPRFDTFQDQMLKSYSKNFQIKKIEIEQRQENIEGIKLWDKQFSSMNNNIIISDPFFKKVNVEKDNRSQFELDQLDDIKLQMPPEKIELLEEFVFTQILKEVTQQLFFSKIFTFIQKIQYFTPINLPTTTLQDQYLDKYLNHLLEILPSKKILMEKINQKMGPTPQQIFKGMREDEDYQVGDYEVVLNHQIFLKSTEFIKKLPKLCESCEEWTIKEWDQDMLNFYKKREIELKNRKEKLINLTLDMQTIYFKSIFDALNQKIIDIKLFNGLNGRIIGMSQLQVATTDMNKPISIGEMEKIIKEAMKKVHFYMNLKIIGDFDEFNPIVQRQANKMIIKMLQQQIEQNQARWLNRTDQTLQISLQITQYIQESIVNEILVEFLTSIFNIQK